MVIKSRMAFHLFPSSASAELSGLAFVEGGMMNLIFGGVHFHCGVDMHAI